jgi:hypothetical protein
VQRRLDDDEPVGLLDHERVVRGTRDAMHARCDLFGDYVRRESRAREADRRHALVDLMARLAEIGQLGIVDRAQAGRTFE